MHLNKNDKEINESRLSGGGVCVCLCMMKSVLKSQHMPDRFI